MAKDKLKFLKKLPLEECWSFNIGWANEMEVNVVVTPHVRRSRDHRDSILGAMPERHGEPAALFAADGKTKSYLFLPPQFDPDTVAHECYHLVDYIMGYLGVIQRDAEVMAYHMGHTVGKVSEIYLRIKKQKLTRKRKKRTITLLVEKPVVPEPTNRVVEGDRT